MLLRPRRKAGEQPSPSLCSGSGSQIQPAFAPVERRNWRKRPRRKAGEKVGCGDSATDAEGRAGIWAALTMVTGLLSYG